MTLGVIAASLWVNGQPRSSSFFSCVSATMLKGSRPSAPGVLCAISLRWRRRKRAFERNGKEEEIPVGQVQPGDT